MRSVLIVAVGLVFLAGSLLVTVSIGRGEAAGSRDQQLQADVGTEAARIDEYFERARSVVLLMAHNPAFRDYYDAPGSRDEKLQASIPAVVEANEALRYLESIYTDSIGEACFIDASGPEIARAVRGEVAAIDDLSLDETGATFFWPTFALDYGQVNQALPYISPDTGEWVISNATLVPFSDGSKQAIVHFEVTIDSFGAGSAAESSRFRIVDDAGLVVVDSLYPQLVSETLGRPDQTQFVNEFAIDGPTSGVRTVGAERIAFQRVGANPSNENVWYVVTATTASIGILAGFGPLSIAMLAIGAALIGLAVASGRHQSHLREQAMTDALTGLPNRNLFWDRATQALALAQRQGSQAALLLIDLDDFKRINDTLGHHRGDELLCDVSRRLQGAMRDSDTVARLGGDEFAVILADTAGQAGALDAVERITQDVFSAHRLIGGVPIPVKGSIGIAMFPADGRDADLLLQHADVAMYHAKRNRLDYCLYNKDLDPNSQQALAMASELDAALSSDQMVVHYQPKFEVSTSTLIGMEALIRWEHPSRGLLLPDAFLEAAEAAGVMAAITRHVLTKAIEELHTWHQQMPDITIAINISPSSLSDPNFPTDLTTALNNSGLDAQYVILEITENAVINDPNQAIETLTQLRELGIKIALDDFGTGFSTLAHLRRLPLDELKIDQTFIHDLANSTQDQAIVKSTIEMAHSLNLTTTAEGIEDPEAMNTLIAMNCDAAQGFWLAKPAPPQQLDALLTNQTTPSQSQ
ncbi:EAL domain-containing protein [Acidimicrobiaceae bacterium AH-315-P05]|nr:EAL domain-containing protein [Acidimicrobiaceae bacterium AH-315-P05]